MDGRYKMKSRVAAKGQGGQADALQPQFCLNEGKKASNELIISMDVCEREKMLSGFRRTVEATIRENTEPVAGIVTGMQLPGDIEPQP